MSNTSKQESPKTTSISSKHLEHSFKSPTPATPKPQTTPPGKK